MADIVPLVVEEPTPNTLIVIEVSWTFGALPTLPAPPPPPQAHKAIEIRNI